MDLEDVFWEWLYFKHLLSPTSAAHLTRQWSYFIRKGLALTLSTMATTVHITRTAGQMLFEGYPEPLFKLANTMPFFVDQPLPPWNSFAWFYMRNGSTDYEGVFNMGTGENSIFGKLYSWNHWTKTPYYEGECGRVDGSAGELYLPNPGQDSISFFSSDACRIVTLKYERQTKVKNILGNKYTLDAYMLDNGTLYPENKCFCNGECVPSGVLNVTSCKHGSPSFVSLPHFHNADPYYVGLVDGLQPEKEKHEFFITLEPNTGIPLEVKARFQINLLLQPTPGMTLYEEVPKTFIPVLWFEQRIEIPDHYAFMLKLFLNLPIMCNVISIFMMVTGFVIFTYVVYKNCTIMYSYDKDKYLYREQSVSLKLNQK